MSAADDDSGGSVLTAPAPEPDDADAEPNPRTPRRLLRAAVALVAAAATVMLLLLSFSDYQDRQTDALRAQAVQTSRDYLVTMASFDYQQIDAGSERIVADSTPEFAAKYDEMVTALRDIVVTSQGVATATADHVVVESLDGHSATVIAFVDQHVTNVTAPQGSDQKYRMVVTLVRSADRWIVDDVQTV